MFVSNWMTRKVVTIGPEEAVSEAMKIMKERGIKHIPVLKGDKLRGIISDRDIKEYTPSKATALDIYELHYLLAKARVKEVMKTRVITTSPETPVEEAAAAMFDNGVGCLPVVEEGRLVGIMSDRDIFRVLIDITGVRYGGLRIYLTMEDRPGSIKDAADIIRAHGFGLQSILTSYELVKEGYRRVVIRTKGKGDLKGLQRELEETYRGVSIREKHAQ